MAPRYVLGLTIKVTPVVNEVNLDFLTKIYCDSMTKWMELLMATAIHHRCQVGSPYDEEEWSVLETHPKKEISESECLLQSHEKRSDYN